MCLLREYFGADPVLQSEKQSTSPTGSDQFQLATCGQRVCKSNPSDSPKTMQMKASRMPALEVIIESLRFWADTNQAQQTPKLFAPAPWAFYL